MEGLNSPATLPASALGSELPGRGSDSPREGGGKGFLLCAGSCLRCGRVAGGPFHPQNHSGLTLAQRWEVCAWQPNVGTEGSALWWWCPLVVALGTTPFLERRPLPEVVGLWHLSC